jgi:hypothetical protein
MNPDESGINLDVIFNAVDTADVLIVRFPFIASRLLVDARSEPDDPPVIGILPQASGIEERFRTVREARPRLPVPERIISFHWPRRAAFLESSGVWARIVTRITAGGHAKMEERCRAAWEALLREERREEAAALRGGQRYETIWERTPSGG